MGSFIHQSVSAILTSGRSFYIVKRSQEMRYFPGYWAFPGGKVSKEDGEEAKLFNALTRELLEELDYQINKNQVDSLGKVTTPKFAPYRFENHFFHIELDHCVDFKLDTEHIEGKWINFDDRDEFFSNPGRLTIPPIRWYVDQLAQGKKDQYVSNYLDKDQEILKASYIHGVQSYMVPSTALPPSKHTNLLEIESDNECLLVDPSPESERLFKELCLGFKDKRVVGIFISHWHPDHHQFLPDLARKLGTKIFLSLETKKQINNRWGESYFKGLELVNIDEGDRIGVGSKTYQVKRHTGHAIGQVGLESEDKSWVFLSDVFQGVGSVVVEEMDEYMDTLEKLLSYPESTVFIPSHGFPIGGTSQLKQLYKHRLKREESIAKLLDANRSEEEILESLYPKLNDGMKRYALKNIKGHIRRIRKTNI